MPRRCVRDFLLLPLLPMPDYCYAFDIYFRRRYAYARLMLPLDAAAAPRYYAMPPL